MTKKSYIIFDLDETIGQFVQLGCFYKGLIQYFNKVPTKNDFYQLLNRCNKYFRPKIFEILNHIKVHKLKDQNLKVIIYTNNQGGKSWVTKIKDFMELKIQYRLFDRIIGPHKIRHELYEILRSTESKCYDDLVKIIDCNDKEDILFLDDNFFTDMLKDNVIYLLVKPYRYYYTNTELINIFLSYNTIENVDQFTNYMINYMSNYDESKSKSFVSNEDIEMSNKIISHIKDFLSKIKHKKSNRKTLKKRKRQIKNKTLKFY